MSAHPPTAIPPDLEPLVRQWGRRWGLPDLADHLSVRFSDRMTRSLGRCRPASGRVRLAAHLQDGPAALLEEVLCHEVAHVAVHQLQGRGSPPHGPIWRELVEAAGYPARMRAPATSTATAPSRPTGPRPRYVHRCPVCHTERMARRPVPEWRCAECLAAGLDGRLEITRLAPDPAADA
ncbi:MAG: SprT family zinc-dependent metalloprotease [Gemmatimonadota bacterium]